MALIFSGEKLKQARVSRGLTQEQLATKLDIRVTNVSKWENDRSAPNGINMVLLIRALGCELEEVSIRVP